METKEVTAATSAINFRDSLDEIALYYYPKGEITQCNEYSLNQTANKMSETKVSASLASVLSRNGNTRRYMFQIFIREHGGEKYRA